MVNNVYLLWYDIVVLGSNELEVEVILNQRLLNTVNYRSLFELDLYDKMARPKAPNLRPPSKYVVDLNSQYCIEI